MRIFIYSLLLIVGIGFGFLLKGMVRHDRDNISVQIEPIKYMTTVSEGFNQRGGGGSCGS